MEKQIEWLEVRYLYIAFHAMTDNEFVRVWLNLEAGQRFDCAKCAVLYILINPVAVLSLQKMYSSEISGDISPASQSGTAGKSNSTFRLSQFMTFRRELLMKVKKNKIE